MNHLSLFSGIGGLDLGLERAGMTTVGQVELNEYARRVLAKHWPEVPRHDDVRTFPTWWSSAERPVVHLVGGGFPCQGHSVAGLQLGIDDPRWGWPWYRDAVDHLIETQEIPPLVLIENVPNLLRTGFEFVLRDLAERGFDAWWTRIPAAALGAPHLRRRLIVLAAHPDRIDGRAWGPWGLAGNGSNGALVAPSRLVEGWDGAIWSVADPERGGCDRWPGALGEENGWGQPEDGSQVVADSARSGLETRGREAAGNTGDPAFGGGRWPAEPDVGRVAYGVPDRVDRLRGLGNAVVPDVGEWVGRMILSALAG